MASQHSVRTRAALAALVFLLPALASEGIAGKWDVVWDTEGGVRRQQWSVSGEAESVTLEFAGNEFQGTFKDGRLEFSGNFYSAEAGYSAVLKVEGRLTDGQLSGNGTWDQYAMTFTATRAE